MPTNESEELTVDQFRHSPEGKEEVPDFKIEDDTLESDTPAEGSSTAEQTPSDETAQEAPPASEPESTDAPDLSEQRGLTAELEKTQKSKADLKAEIMAERAALRALKQVQKMQTGEPVAAAPIDPTAPVTQEQLYNNTANLMTQEFLKDHTEFIQENDPLDENWTALMAEYNKYAKPLDPHKVGEVLQWAHADLLRKKVSHSPKPNPQKVAAAKKNLATAGQGSGGNTAPHVAPKGELNEEYASILRRGGWPEDEVQEIARR